MVKEEEEEEELSDSDDDCCHRKWQQGLPHLEDVRVQWLR
jgi:hypothetical protein